MTKCHGKEHLKRKAFGDLITPQNEKNNMYNSNSICYDHLRSDVWRSGHNTILFISNFFLEKLVDAHASSASDWGRLW